MPFTPYKSVLDPYDLAVALEAFDLAWAEIIAVPDAYDMKMARDLLAQRIIEAVVEQGERDPERLKAYALDEFDPGQQA